MNIWGTQKAVSTIPAKLYVSLYLKRWDQRFSLLLNVNDISNDWVGDVATKPSGVTQYLGVSSSMGSN